MSLGCGSTSYTITDRDNGGIVTASGVLTSVEYNRVLNDASTATATLGVSGPACCRQLGGVRSWRHMLNLYRNGSFIWSGFITNVDWNFDNVVVDATDIIGLLDRRVPHSDMSFTGTDITEIARRLVEDGLAPDDPGHTVTVIDEAGVTGGRTYSLNVGQTADHLRDLAGTGLDFTAVGNNIVIMPDGFCDVVGRLSDQDFPSGLTVSEDGASLATRQLVAGADGVIGVAGGVNAYYGLLEIYSEQTNITDQTSADAAAKAALASSLGVPVFIATQNVTLSPTANVDLAALVPGWCVDVTTAATCREITQRLKVTGVKVSEDGGTGSGQPGQESITVTLAATGDNLAVVELPSSGTQVQES
ncbi:minor tail protein [Streptomyces phage Mischief19]|nr:minor tail protein [Streptomyces phage Mischief19]